MNIKRSILKRIRLLLSINKRYNLKKELLKTPKSFEFKEFENPKVSIIIPVYNQFNSTKACLWKILNNTCGIDYEIIIADDNSSDETKNISDVISGLRVIRNVDNKGFLLNVNNAVNFAKGEFIVLMNNDIFVEPNWLNIFLETMQNDENIGYLGAKYLNEKGLIQEAGCKVNSDGSTTFTHNGELAWSKSANELMVVDYCSACGVIFRKKTWNQLGGFDTLFAPSYYEDVDLCFRIKNQFGLKVMYQPKSVMYHLHGTSHGQKSTDWAMLNKEKFYEKWKDVLV